MTRRSILWRVGAVIFTVVNVGGAAYAYAMGEAAHATAHVLLLALGASAYVIWLLASRARRQNANPAQLPEGRLDYLQQSVDAIALEVERIGEAQRFNEKLRNAKGEAPPPPKKDQ
ncbi:MAG TPA: hypothetical protein VK478_02245 [Gemmatimonadaceae bacterium]|jgi:hypothetical protein|nr:hypothetical protein [Gemmatimonadaceae bacterium]